MGDAGVDALEQSAGPQLDLYIYPGEGHLFADPAGPDSDEPAAELMLSRELEFLGRLD